MLRLLLISLAFLAGPVSAAADEAALGKAEGYPVCTLQEMGRNEKCLVGTPQFALLGLRGQGVFVDPETRTVVVHTAAQSLSSGDPHRAEQFGLFFGAINAATQQH